MERLARSWNRGSFGQDETNKQQPAETPWSRISFSKPGQALGTNSIGDWGLPLGDFRLGSGGYRPTDYHCGLRMFVRCWWQVIFDELHLEYEQCPFFSVTSSQILPDQTSASSITLSSEDSPCKVKLAQASHPWSVMQCMAELRAVPSRLRLPRPNV